MTTAKQDQAARRRRFGPRTAAALLAALVGTGVTAVPGPTAAAADPPWLTVSDGFASFSIPNAFVAETMGSPQLLNVEGNFGPSANWSELGLSQFGGAWTATIGPLEPGAYHYRIAADDGRVVLKDPTNPTTVASEPAWSTFVVPGPAAGPVADPPGGPVGAIGTLRYPGTPGPERTATVWTPPGYDAHRREAYPVLYLLDDTDDATDWRDLGRAGQILDNLARQHRTTPMVVVMAAGDALDGPEPGLLRAARSAYNIARDGARQAVAGAAAGGVQAVRAALADPARYGYVGSFSALDAPVPPQLDGRAANGRIRLLRLYTGNPTDPGHNATLRLMRRLDRAGIRYDFDGVAPDVGGNWDAWQDDLADFLPRLFRPTADHRASPGHLPLTREFTAPAAGTTPTPWLSRAANGDRFMTVETGPEYASARHVTLWGNWAPGGAWLRVPMTRQGDRWRVTVGPLPPAFYYYQFIVDLAAKKDLANPTRISTEPNWSTFLVEGPASRRLADVPAGRGGTVSTLTYDSTVAGQPRSAYVWTPPGYDAHRARPYPVLYLQHGGGQHYTDWVEMGRAKQILDHLSLERRLVPMVVVMGDGNVADFTTELRDNIVPATRAHYNVSAEPAGQALAGLSMGGFQTFDVLVSHPGEFAWIGTFSSALRSADGVDAAAINQGTKLLRIYTGNVTDFVYPFTMSTLQTLDGLGVHYEFAGITPGPHGWDTWQKNLVDFAPRLFRTDRSQADRPA